jgi:anaerobic selenocysteine-containing dehydrogenase
MSESRTVYRVCTLCEATCGIALEIEEERVVSIKGDENDPFSQGYICPKATAMKGLHEDPDRLRKPLRKRTDGTWEEIGWDEAIAYAAKGLLGVRERHGSEGLASYFGNPTVHSLHTTMYSPIVNRALASKQRFSASTADQFPKMVTAGLMFGENLTIPIPDLDRTDYLMVLGANPLASNGSLMTAPNVKGRLRDIRGRGGKVVVIDPRRSETADVADEHLFIRPGADAYFLLAMANTMFEENLVDLGTCAEHVAGLDEVRDAIVGVTAQSVAARCGIEAETIRRITREFVAAPSAACYGRIGTTCQEFGTLASWAVDIVNILSGNMDRPGGVMFTRAAAAGGSSDEPGGTGVQLHRWNSRVSGYPEVFGEIPVAAFAEEIETEGEGQIRGLLTLAGNPARSTPDTERLERALTSLEFMVSVDIYLNETTRHADVILPPTSALEHEHYDLAFYRLSVRNIAKFSPAVFEPEDGALHDWQILARLSAELMGFGPMSADDVDDFVLGQLVDKAIPEDGSKSNGKSRTQVLEELGSQRGPHRALDLMLRTGPYGDGFGTDPDGLSLAKLKEYPHGLDLGPLMPQVPQVLETPSAKIEMSPALVLDDLPRLRAGLDRDAEDLVLIGRRHLRSNNSWCHNIEPLVKGRDRCTLMMNPADASRFGLGNGDRAQLTSRVGSVVAPVEITDELMPGVVSLPHGWGHDVEGVRMGVAREHAGVNSNALTDSALIDRPSGNAVLNGIPVVVEAAG